MKKFLYRWLLLPVMLCSLSGCGGLTDNRQGSILESANEIPTEEATKPEVPEGAITDDSGEFVYAGKLQQIGDDENGYIQVPLGYVQFQDVDVQGLTQYSDVTGKNIITLEFYEGYNYQTVADNVLSFFQQDENVMDLNGATVTVAGYNALQLYGYYNDGYLIVIWFIEDPADSSNTYYLAMEFDSDHDYLVACSSTFQTVEDYHASREE